MRFSRLQTLVIICLVLLLPFSCKRAKTAEKTGITISAFFYPQYIMLLNITEGADVQLSLLAPPDTGCLHDYELTVRDMQHIAAADVVVINGAGMETFTEKVAAGKNIIDASKDITLINQNPHIWVSPWGAAAQTENIAVALAQIDPKNAETYRINAKNYMQKLGSLDKQMHAELDPFSGSEIVVFHEAFPYLADEFNFKIAAVIEHEPGTEPTARELLETIQIIQETRAAGKTIFLFAEKQYPSTAAEVIARETGLTVYELDSAVTGELLKDAYIDAMTYNTRQFVKAMEVR